MENIKNTILGCHLKKIGIATAVLALSGCVNQNTKAQQKLEPVSNACQKIDLLINAYDTNFEQLKETKIKARVSDMWQAKYHLIGNNCKIWTWGEDQTTYSCNTIEVDEKIARDYYNGAKNTLQQCLGEEWQLTESKRNHDDGLKAEYSTKDKAVTLSTHLVPSNGVYQSKWSVYYYIGKTK